MADEKSIPNGLPPKSGAQHDASEEETPTFAKLPLDEEVVSFWLQNPHALPALPGPGGRGSPCPPNSSA